MLPQLSKLVLVSGSLLLLGVSCVGTGGSGGAIGPAGVFRSADKGETWAAIVAQPTAQGVKSLSGVSVFRIFPDPADPNALYLGTRGQGMFYSYDKGESWQTVPVLSGKYIYALAINPQDKCTIYVSDGSHIYKSVDCSRTWRLVYTEERPAQRVVALSIDYGRTERIFGALVGGDIIRSENGGTSWQVIKRFNFEVQELKTDPLGAGRVYVGSASRGLYRSDDGGDSWYDFEKPLLSFSEASTFYRLILHPAKKNVIFWVSKYGILRSPDAGASWTELKLLTPPGSVSIYAFAVNPRNDNELFYVGTLLGEKGVPARSTFYRSIDGGVNWVTKKLPTNTIPVGLHIHPTEATLYLVFTIVS